MTRRYRKYVDNASGKNGLNEDLRHYEEFEYKRALELRLHEVRKKTLGQTVQELLAVKPKK